MSEPMIQLTISEGRLPEAYRSAFREVEGHAADAPQSADSDAGPYRSAPAPDDPPWEFYVAEVESPAVLILLGVWASLGLGGVVLFGWLVAKFWGDGIGPLVIGGGFLLFSLVFTVRVVLAMSRARARQRAVASGTHGYGYYLFDDALVVRKPSRVSVIPWDCLEDARVEEQSYTKQDGVNYLVKRLELVLEGRGAPLTPVTISPPSGLEREEFADVLLDWRDG